MNFITKFFHELMHPHCPDCIHEIEDSRVCQSCETLKLQLDIANKEKQDLLKSILDKDKPVVAPVKEPDEPVKLKSPIPWAVRRQLLEQNSVKQAQLLKESKREAELNKDIEELEKEVGLDGTTGE